MRLTTSTRITICCSHSLEELIGTSDEKGQPKRHEDACCAEDVDVVLPVGLLGRVYDVHCR